MKKYLSILSVVMVFAAIIGACYAENNANIGVMQPNPQVGATQPNPATGAQPPTGSGVTQPGANPNMQPPSGTGPGQPTAMTGQQTCPSTCLTTQPACSAVTVSVDDQYVYILAGNMLYRYAKNTLSNYGTPVPQAPQVPCNPCNTCGMNPCAPTCTTCGKATPCVPPANVCAPTGCGPCPPVPVCPISSDALGMAMDNSYVYVLRGNMLYKYAKSALNTCGISVPNYPTTPVSLCGVPGNICPPVGAGPCSLSTNAVVSPQVQATIDCLNQLCGCELDKAYLVAMLQIQPSVISISTVATQYATGTNLQDFAMNSVSDANSITNEFSGWLRTKFCMNVAICVPPVNPAFDICNLKLNGPGEFDSIYRAEIVRYYVDEIALSQVYVCRGQDCEILKAAKKIIENDQERIKELTRTRCGSCL